MRWSDPRAVSLDGAAPTPVASTYVQNAPGAKAGDPGALDFKYVTNAGSNGNLSLLANGDARQRPPCSQPANPPHRVGRPRGK
jgi:hypothetical protein